MELSGEADVRSSGTRILYAEDDADTRELVSYLLSRAGYEVAVAANLSNLHVSRRRVFPFTTPKLFSIRLNCLLRK